MKTPDETITEIIRGLKPRQDIVIPGKSANSIRSIVSRIRDEFEGRDYYTKAVTKGVRVWRLE